VKMLTMQKIDQIKGKIKELESLKDQLSHLAAGCDGDDRPDCPILDALSNGKVSNGKVSAGKIT
jgi:MerR family copper efflux transcriptional regulator